MYAVAGTSELIGQRVSAYPRRNGALAVRLIEPELFENVNAARGSMPLHVRGRVYGRTAQTLAVVVNGQIAATTTPHLERGTTVFATMIPERLLKPGANEIATFVVERQGGSVTFVATRSPD